MHIFGLDLGTCTSAQAVWLDSQLCIIPNERGKQHTPSVAAYLKDSSVLIGETAVNQALVFPEAVIQESKRWMGKKQFWQSPQGEKTPVQVAADILSKFRELAGKYLGEEAKYLVLAIPAHFNDSARRACLKAADLAGWEVKRLLNEPTAAVLSQSALLPEKARVLVFDLGGGTFDTSLVEKDQDFIRVIASDGKEALGGKDFDRRLFQLILQKVLLNPEDIMQDPAAYWQFMQLAEQVKIDLSELETLTCLLPKLQSGSTLDTLTITRVEFEEVVDDLIQECLDLCKTLLDSQNGNKASLDYILLSGGSSRIPLVQKKLAQAFPGVQILGLNPDEAVALGAAWYGKLLSEGRKELLQDVCTFDLGLEIDEKSFYPLITRNTAVPCKVSRRFETMDADQEQVDIKVLQRDLKVQELGLLRLKDLEAETDGKARLQIEFELDENEILRVKASDVNGPRQKTQVLSLRQEEAQAFGGDAVLPGLLRELALFLDSGRLPEALAKTLEKRQNQYKNKKGPLNSEDLEEFLILLDEARQWTL